MEGKENMKRLTNNKEVSEMNMCELAYNSCYAKDRKARYRDFENDFDARELAIKLLEKYTDISNEFTCDEDFDDFMADALQYGIDDILGLIAVFYRNLWAMADLSGRLKEYEDLEEQGKLLKPKCLPGDYVWEINKERNIISEYEVSSIRYGINKTFRYMWILRDGIYGDLDGFGDDGIGKNVFLVREEAEAALKTFN